MYSLTNEKTACRIACITEGICAILFGLATFFTFVGIVGYGIGMEKTLLIYFVIFALALDASFMNYARVKQLENERTNSESQK